MREAVIVSTARTGLAKSVRGGFNMTHGATMGGHAVQQAIKKAGIDAAEVEDVYMGCAQPEGATGMNVARNAAIWAGCPVSTGGVTINRFCSSGLQAIAMAAQQIITEGTPVAVGSGVESNPKLVPLKELEAPTIDAAKLNGRKVIELMTQAGLL